MEHYPSISKEPQSGAMYFFDKLDGNNIRAEWGRKKGKWGEFWKFGTRNQLLDASNEDYGEAIQLIKDKYESALTEIFRKQQWQEVICFFEFWGKSSFAGRHVKEEPHTVTLFDIRVHKKGFILPRDYLKLVGHLDIAKLLHYGYTSEIIEQVKNGTLANMTFEGVVGKENKYVTPGIPNMFKIKSDAWLAKLKDYCNGDIVLFEKLK